MSPRDRPVLAPELAGTVAYAGVDPTLEGRALQDALRAAIGIRGGGSGGRLPVLIAHVEGGQRMPSLDGMDALPASDVSGRLEQQPAAPEVGEAGEAPGLGALNRQLRLLTEQLGAAHRLIGQIAAERDGLRQQIADLQGIPFDAIVVPSVAATTEHAAVPHVSGPQRDPAPAEASGDRIGRVGRIRRRLPSRWRNQNSPRR